MQPPMPPDTLAALHEALREHPNREAEFARISALLRMQSQVDAFATARQQGASKAQLRAMAEPIAQALPAQLLAGSVGGGEALVLQSALLDVMTDTPAQAKEQLAAWRAKHLPEAAGPTPQEQSFLQAQAQLVAQQATPAQFQKLREQHFR
jgi:hypothetical protein